MSCIYELEKIHYGANVHFNVTHEKGPFVFGWDGVLYTIELHEVKDKHDSFYILKFTAKGLKHNKPFKELASLFDYIKEHKNDG